MALVEKKGGPYTKDDQEGRRKEVARLHFEYGYSARRIADMMKINRNTISSDVRYWYDIIKEETREKRDDLFLQQIGRLEAQRTRIIECIMNESSDKIKLEKLLLEVDGKISNMLMRTSAEQNRPKEQNREPLIREIVLFLIIKHAKNPSLTKETIVCEIVNTQQCTTSEAENMFSEMISLGLECCRKFRNAEFFYDFIEFAILRKYLKRSDKFFKQVYTLTILHYHMAEEMDGLEKKYQSEFGNKEMWSDETFAKFDNEKMESRKKSANALSETIAGIVESIDGVINGERFLEYMQCVNVFFGKEKTMMEEMLDEL